jgi:hypothetical protein
MRKVFEAGTEGGRAADPEVARRRPWLVGRRGGREGAALAAAPCWERESGEIGSGGWGRGMRGVRIRLPSLGEAESVEEEMGESKSWLNRFPHRN